MTSLRVWIGTVSMFLAIDLVWLGFVVRDFNLRQIGNLSRVVDGGFAPIWWAALLVYVLIPVGIIVFVLPRVSGTEYLSALLWGALYGCIVYGVYELTNYSILSGWPLAMVVADMLWGIVLCAGITALAVFLRS